MTSGIENSLSKDRIKSGMDTPKSTLSFNEIFCTIVHPVSVFLLAFDPGFRCDCLPVS